MTNLPTGTTGTTPATRRRRLDRVITVGALAAGVVVALAGPAQAAIGHHTYPVAGTNSTAVSGSRNGGTTDCSSRQQDNGGWYRSGISDFDRYFSGGATCAPAGQTTAPATRPATTTNPSSSVTARGATINYNEGYAGSCVFYALDRFHQRTGVYPKAFGDARYLATGAAASGWSTGSTPRINSLVVFQPGQNGAGGPTGHVAWVEQVSGNQIYISEMNAPTPYVVTRRWLTPVAGVRYVYA
jgi:surface antigen